jgi:cell division septal protein FtsQ
MANVSMAEEKQKAEKHYRSEVHRRQRKKNLVLFAVLAACAVLIYFVAIVRMTGGG